MEQLDLVETKNVLRHSASGDMPFKPVSEGFQLQYVHRNGCLYQGNSFDWLETLDDASVDLVFADPPYNIKKAGWDNFDSQEKYIDWSIQWIKQVSRVLKPTGSLYVCGFSEILADLKYPASKYFKHCRWLIWHYKNKANLGNRKTAERRESIR
ncbi:DNA methylase [Thiothrix eikelboomii]|uniref:Methyltransferase n=1 Tax=Thiothrix eikelboomii TaxID=92487 RepID=A0A1T4XWT9_9GAMM|nr:DNA methyltransferase [Thiothrix eikelboomii]SKA93501.1 DNA methylase [Thiothrix eikelboomii]